jgi:hypothetical protein
LLTFFRNKQKKVILWICVAGVIGMIGIAIFLTNTFNLIFSHNNKLTTATSSCEFKTMEEKSSFLKKYMIINSEVRDTEYRIFFQDNSGVPPGPSDWDIKVALMMQEENLDKWLAGFEEISANMVSLSWWDDLNLDDNKWHLSSTPQFYKRPDVSSYLVLFRDEGIVLKYITTQKPMVKQ